MTPLFSDKRRIKLALIPSKAPFFKLSGTGLFGNKALLFMLQQMLSNHKYPSLSILAGPMGVGKSTTAKLIASYLAESDNTRIKFFNFGTSQNLNEIEQAYFKNAPISPIVLIFDEFQYLEYEQQRAFPAMLDNRPTNVYIIITTAEKRKILKPIVSRAQIFEFKPLTSTEMMKLLNEDSAKEFGSYCSKEVSNLIIKKSNGIPRDLLNFVDTIFSSGISDDYFFQIFDSVADNQISFLFNTLKVSSIDFAEILQKITADFTIQRLKDIKDFWARYLLCRLNSKDKSLDKTYIKQLNELYTSSDLQKITKTLIDTNEENFLLDMLRLNMILTNTSKQALTGQQKVVKDKKQEVPIMPQSKSDKRLSISGIRELKLD